MKSFSILSRTLLTGIFSATLCACGAATFSTTSISDAFVATGTGGNNLSADNFGAAGALAIAAPNLPLGDFQSVIKFDLSAVRNSFDSEFGEGHWTVQSVTLQLTATTHSNPIFNNVAAGQFNISLMQNNSWVEGSGTGGLPTTDGISHNTLLNTFINGSTDEAEGVFSFGGNTSGVNSYQLNLTPGILTDLQGGSNLTLRLFAADSSVSYLFSSRSGSGASPTLIINAVPEPGTIALGLLGLASAVVWRERTKFRR